MNDIEMINQVFAKYNLSVSETIEGTRINRYKILLPIDIDVNKLLRLKKNLIIALRDNSINVFQDAEYLVIEKQVSNTILTMQECFFKSMYQRNDKMRLVLGKDIEGNTITTSLIKAPHMLVSGCTGAGKTQLLHSFISSLLIGNETCHLILIDPKGNEFNIYKDIDTVQFIDNVSDGIQILQWLVDEMNSRYKIMSQENATDISKTKYTRIVCIIDEFADLIKTDRNIEKYVVLIAQKARAAGIHLIIGTQYPKAEILTGLIQANIPTRICLKVNSNVQSRIALGLSGGEKLIGHGDMLYLGNGNFEPIRIQAPYISDKDKQRVVQIVTPQLKGLGGNINKQKKTEPEKISYEHLIHPNKPEPTKKRVGLIQGLINIINSPQCTTPNDFTAMRAAHRWNKS